MPKRTFLCRCEDVTLAELEHAIEAGMTTLEELKRYTGFGTGPCQGKECQSIVAAFLCQRGLIDPKTVQPFTVRPPTEPVTLATLAAGAPPKPEESP
jgi:sarcosine oxidase subunit beta